MEPEPMIVGLDTNILCYALDPAYPEHERLKDLVIGLSPEKRIAINPTIIHETYHTLVFGQKWVPREACKRLKLLLRHPYIEFFGQTKKMSIIALNLAEQYKLGGRDSLITANFLANKVPIIYTSDKELIDQKIISWKNFHVIFKDPLSNP
jgi:predicted nucleic acid-binding protein